MTSQDKNVMSSYRAHYFTSETLILALEDFIASETLKNFTFDTKFGANTMLIYLLRHVWGQLLLFPFTSKTSMMSVTLHVMS